MGLHFKLPQEAEKRVWSHSSSDHEGTKPWEWIVQLVSSRTQSITERWALTNTWAVASLIVSLHNCSVRFSEDGIPISCFSSSSHSFIWLARQQGWPGNTQYDTCFCFKPLLKQSYGKMNKNIWFTLHLLKRLSALIWALLCTATYDAYIIHLFCAGHQYICFTNMFSSNVLSTPDILWIHASVLLYGVWLNTEFVSEIGSWETTAMLTMARVVCVVLRNSSWTFSLQWIAY